MAAVQGCEDMPNLNNLELPPILGIFQQLQSKRYPLWYILTNVITLWHWNTQIIMSTINVITVAKRGLQSTMLATASYRSKNGHISKMSHRFCDAFSAKRVQDQIKWATASQINTIFGISWEWCTSLRYVFSFMYFCPFPTDCTGHYHALFCMILGSFKY